MAISGRRLGLLILVFPLAILFLWLEWDIRVADAAIGVLLALVFFRNSTDGDGQPTPARLLLYAVGGVIGSLFTAFLVQSLADASTTLYGTITTDSRLLRKVSHARVLLAAFALTMFVRVMASVLWPRREGGT